MKDYLLFIDTEASGLPKNWHLPYDAEDNWPYAVQVSWLIYNKEGEKIKEENHYISDNDFEISKGALRIHGLTKYFLAQNGLSRKCVLGKLTSDLQQYQPMIVGHFIELDYHVLSAAYFRENIFSPLLSLPTFCIMKASEHLQLNPNSKFLRLGELYQLLFKKPLLGQHNAMTDASATADCFFELEKKKEINTFTQPSIVIKPQPKISGNLGWVIAFCFIILSAFLIACYYG